MRKSKIKSLERFLQEIDDIKSKATELNKFENNSDNTLDSLRMSELKDHDFLKNSQACTKIVDLDFNLHYMSDIGVDLLKIDDINEFYGKCYPLSFYPDSFKISMQDCLEKVKSTQKSAIHEGFVISKTGEKVWFQSTLIPINDDGGNFDHIMIVALNITERKNAELAIFQSQKFHESLLQTTPDIIYVYDLLEHKNIYSNDGNLNVIGYSMQDIHDFGNNLLSSIMHPKDYKNYINNVVPKYDKLKDGEILELEYRAKHKTGDFKWLHSRESVFKRLNGKPIQIIGVTRDITERKKIELDLKLSEEKLKEALEITQLGKFVFDDDINFFEISVIGNKILGIDKSYKRDIQGWINLVHTDDFQHIQCLFDDPNLKYVSLEFRVIRPKDKRIVWISGYAKKVFNKKGERIKITGTFQDITERKKIDEELEKYRKQLETENILLKKEMSLSFNFKEMVYASTQMKDVLTMVEQVATTDANVLILGETGTGKELIAKAIHKTSHRKNNSLISVNCSAIPSELIESELFGHVKGSFTGAINNRLGKFELADGGTLFLDEIGEMPLLLQPKLLRAIQEGEIEPIGSSKLKKLDVRIIAATNKDLKEEVKEKNFREDLYFRLNVFPINIPPLRNRIDDITVLTEHFVNKYSKKYKKEIKYISDITMQQLKYYNWPGNVRELENLIERAIIVSNSNVLVIHGIGANTSKIAPINNGHTLTLEQIQIDHILKTLNDTNWKIDGKDGAAQLLDIKPSTLRDRMKKFNIQRS